MLSPPLPHELMEVPPPELKEVGKGLSAQTPRTRLRQEEGIFPETLTAARQHAGGDAGQSKRGGAPPPRREQGATATPTLRDVGPAATSEMTSSFRCSHSGRELPAATETVHAHVQGICPERGSGLRSQTARAWLWPVT